MKRLAFLVSVLALIVFPLRAVAQHAHIDSPTTTMTVPQPLVVGTTILQPGDYKFRCRTFEGRTFLIVTSVRSGKEVARVAVRS